jgi:hypothetical protein
LFWLFTWNFTHCVLDLFAKGQESLINTRAKHDVDKKKKESILTWAPVSAHATGLLTMQSNRAHLWHKIKINKRKKKITNIIITF